MSDPVPESNKAKQKISLAPGSRQQPFRMALIGGGPAGTSVIARAIHLGFSIDLFSEMTTPPFETGYDIEQYGGICVFDRDTKERFGGGRLQDYQVPHYCHNGVCLSSLQYCR
jgi:hypothetical protein